MPTVTTILMAAGTAYQAVQAMSQKAEADKAANQAALNATKIGQGQTNQLASLKVPTLGTEIAQQNIQARQQADIQALKEGGAATVLGGLTARENQARAQDLQLASQVDEMAYNRDLAVKQQDQAIEDAKLNRQYQLEMSRLQGAQTASAANQAAINQSIGGAVQIAGDVATMNAYKGQDPAKIWGNKKTSGINKAVSAVGRDLNNLDPFAATIYRYPGLTSQG
jgi:hypothetical protein